jgi:hypothetical protein
MGGRGNETPAEICDPTGRPGVTAGVFDAFVLDKLFSGSGPAAFINNQYRSLFTADR